jgi:hypothetical protein
MADIITKILIRQGTNEQRLAAGGTGVIFDSGEPGFTVNTKRFFIGDGVTPGGNPIGIANLGKLDQLFDNTGNFTTAAQTLFSDRGPCIGDIVYDGNTKQIWFFNTTSNPLSPSDLQPFDTSVRYNPGNFSINIDGQLSLKDGGVYASNLDFNVVDNIILTKTDVGAPITVRLQSIENKYLSTMTANSVKVNSSGYTNVPSDLPLTTNTVIGRKTGNIVAVPFSDIVGNALIDGQGIAVDTVGNQKRINMNPVLFDVTEAEFRIKLPTAIQGQVGVEGLLTVFDDATVQGTLRVGQDVIAYTTSDLRLKENLSVINDALEKTGKLTGYEFNYNSNASEGLKNTKSYGLIAQDVEKILPNAVSKLSGSLEDNSYLGVNYEKIIPLLVQAIKELNNKVDTLKKCMCANK